MDNIIKRIQKIQIEILKEVDRICKENKLNYQLFAGTLLGAVRHGGFIPWDDDIDVAMPRGDYEKFLKICKTKLSKEYFLQTFKTDRKCIFPFAKIRKNNTLFINDGNKVLKMHQGIFIDVFPLDKYIIKSKKTKFNNFRANILFNLMIKSHQKFVYNKNKRLLQPLKWMLGIFKIIPTSWYNKRIDRLIKKNINKTTKHVNHLTNGINKKRLERFLMTHEDIDNSIDISFEKHIFPITNNYHEVLTRCYGDYMKLPKEEDRVGHHAKYIAFDRKTLYIYNDNEYAKANDEIAKKYLKLIR